MRARKAAVARARAGTRPRNGMLRIGTIAQNAHAAGEETAGRGRCRERAAQIGVGDGAGDRLSRRPRGPGRRATLSAPRRPAPPTPPPRWGRRTRLDESRQVSGPRRCRARRSRALAQRERQPPANVTTRPTAARCVPSTSSSGRMPAISVWSPPRPARSRRAARSRPNRHVCSASAGRPAIARASASTPHRTPDARIHPGRAPGPVSVKPKRRRTASTSSSAIKRVAS